MAVPHQRRPRRRHTGAFAPLTHMTSMTSALVASMLVMLCLLISACAGTGLDESSLSGTPDSPDVAGTAPAPVTDDDVALAQQDPTAASDGTDPTTQSPSSEAVTSTENSVWLAELTWTEIAEHIASGTTTVIIPTGGTEQNGPHLALDKHNTVVAYTSEQIALRAGNALVAPVMAYVPEGDPSIMDNHLRWAGTISVPDAVFSQVLEAAAQSLAGHGFTTIVFLGDSGSSQSAQASLATKLTNDWAGRGITVSNMAEYYNANGQTEWLLSQGETQEAIGVHAGIRDTSEVLAIAPELVRENRAAASTTPPGQLDARGVDGDPTHASAEYGVALLELKIAAGVAELNALR